MTAQYAKKGRVRSPATVRHHCGTIAGYRAHQYADEQTCQPCRDAATRDFKRRSLNKALGRPGTDWVSNLGTVRRLQALMCLGWPASVVMRRAGMTYRALSRLEQQHLIPPEDAKKIAATFSELCMRLPTDTEVKPPYQTIVRNRAREHGYAPPLAWDNLDDPLEVPVGGIYMDAAVKEEARLVRERARKKDQRARKRQERERR